MQPYSGHISEEFAPPHQELQNEEKGSLAGKNVIVGGKGLSVVLILLGVMGIGVAAAGLASFGGHQNWWSAGALSQIEQIPGIAMMAAGGVVGFVCLTTGIVHFLKQNRIDQEEKRIDGLNILFTKEFTQERLCIRLKDNQHTFVMQKNGNYSLIARQGNAFHTLRADIPLDTSGNLSVPQDLQLSYENFQSTSVTPGVAKRVKELLVGDLPNGELKTEIERICDDPNFRMDPLGYLAPFIDKKRRGISMMGDITDRAVDYFLPNDEVMRSLGRAREKPPQQDSNYRSALSQSDSDFEPI